MRKANSYMREFDIVVAQETWIEKNREKEWVRKLDKGYRWEFKTAERVHKKEKVKGGRG